MGRPSVPETPGVVLRRRTMRRLRMERGMSVAEAARRAGVNASTWWRGEIGERKPFSIAALMMIFGVTEAEARASCPRCGYRPPAGYQCLWCGTPNYDRPAEGR